MHEEKDQAKGTKDHAYAQLVRNLWTAGNSEDLAGEKVIDE